MADVISGWKWTLRSPYMNRFGNNTVRPINRREPGIHPTYSIDLNDEDFDTALPMHEILLESAKPSVEIVQPRLRIILIPSPPPLPTREILIAANRQLHPHTSNVRSSADGSISTA